MQHRMISKFIHFSFKWILGIDADQKVFKQSNINKEVKNGNNS